jgi:hypothetical protein
MVGQMAGQIISQDRASHARPRRKDLGCGGFVLAAVSFSSGAFNSVSSLSRTRVSCVARGLGLSLPVGERLVTHKCGRFLTFANDRE